MKLPRWLVIGMLTSSVLAVLAAAGWWWVTWPERTAREFLILIQDDQWEEAGRMCCPEFTIDATMDQGDREFFRSLRLEMVRPRKWFDVIRARQGFRFLMESGDQFNVLTAQQGRVLNGDPADSRQPFGFNGL